MSISHREITDVVAAAKAEIEALGHVFSTREAIDAYYAQHKTIPEADKQRALLVTLRAAWKLAQRYPNAGIGLEAYGGPSGVPSPFAEDGAEKYAFDIILLSPRGPSVDILAGGIEPVAQIDDTQDPNAPLAWARDWRAPLNPYRGAPPAPAPTPAPEPPHTPAVDLSEVLAALARIQSEVSAQGMDLAELRDLVARGLTGTVQGKWPLGTVRVTLAPKEE